MIPVAATVADRVGRKPVFIAGTLGAAVMMYPYLAAVHAGNWVLIFLLGAVMSGFFYSMANGIWPSFYAEMFPTRVRVTGLALGTQIGFAISGGFAPVLASSLAGDELAVEVVRVEAGRFEKREDQLAVGEGDDSHVGHDQMHRARRRQRQGTGRLRGGGAGAPGRPRRTWRQGGACSTPPGPPAGSSRCRRRRSPPCPRRSPRPGSPGWSRS